MLKKTFSFLVAGLTALLASSSLQTAQAQLSLDTQLVANGLARPVFVTAPVGDFSRIFIVEQRSGTTGRIRIFDFATNSLLATPYLSVSPVLTGNEEGLLGLAFHPDFANNGYFFVYYTATTGNNVVVRYQANAPFATSTTANAASATAVLTIPHPTNTNHNGGWIGFGPDNYLYIGTGDGGSANDPPNNAQNINSLLGKMLRLDVDGDDFPSDATRNYRIPPTNPFAGATAGADEIFHYGLRNPWRNSFDRLTGDMWIGDVGQNAIEEVDFVPAGLGGLNFGWRCMEGAACTALTGCTCNAPTLTLPVYTANHSSGNCSITGGYRYRGSALCNFQGLYFVTDFCTSQIFTFGWNGSAITNLTNRTTDLDPPGTLAIGSIASFGEDAAGELYICDLNGGEVFKVVPGLIADCNANTQHDGCEILAGTAQDLNLDGVIDSCQSTGTASCFGDGSTPTACPCANVGTAGRGCDNSAATGGAKLEAFGDPLSDNVVLQSSGELPTALSIFLQGDVINSNGVVFGDGVRCAGGSLKRLYVRNASGGVASAPQPGNPSITAQSTALGDPIAPLSGATRIYQAYYRDPNLAFCAAPPGNSWNISSAITIIW